MRVSAILSAGGRQKNVLIYIDEILFITAPISLVTLFEIEESMEIEVCHMLNFAVAANLYFCYRDALLLLAGKSRSSKQLQEKLFDKGHAKEAVATVLEIARLRGYLDDQAYAYSYALARVEQRLLGPRAIQQKMWECKFEKDIIKETIHRIYTELDMYDLAMKALERRFSAHRLAKEKNSNRLQQKFYVFLLGKGFFGDTVNSVTREYMKIIRSQESLIDEE